LHIPQLFGSVFRFTHVVPLAPQSAFDPLGQQSPNSAVAFFVMGFTQSRLQQLCGVAHVWPFGLHPPARASVLTRSAMLATSARRAERPSDFAFDMTTSEGRTLPHLTSPCQTKPPPAGMMVAILPS
jgi:hypothetical protein